jgi:DNA-binding IclR family transcriptional regulator
VSVAIKYTQSMTEILDWFNEQPCSCATVGHIADATGWSRETVRNNLKQLQAADAAEQRHEATGEYRLIHDPREDSDDE